MSAALEIQNLTKTYKNGFEALKGINLQVETGDFFALLGANGAGKSTTINIIVSLARKSSGRISVFGLDMDAHPAKVKSFLGLVPQEFNFNQFEQAFDVVSHQAGFYGLPPKLARVRAEKYLKKLRLWEQRQAPMRELSGGMKRRLMIARALVHEPRLLILDEPTAGVDIEIRRMMWGFLSELNAKGTTIILTTHYLEEAEQLCRNIAIIDKGIIVENTSMRKLLEKLDSEYFTLYLREPLTEVPALESTKSRLIDAKTLEIKVNRENDLNSIFAELDHLGIKLVSMRNKTSRLEELFINLTEDS